MRRHRVGVIPGDGTGPEVIAEGLKVLAAVSDGFAADLVPFDLGGERYLRTGEVLPDADLEAMRGLDAIYLGAVGHPDVRPGILERELLLRLRFELDQYVNLRPVVRYPGVETLVPSHTEASVNFVVVRENSEGLYAGAGGFHRKGTAHEVAVQESVNTRHGVERIVRYAFEYARAYGRRRVTCMTKDNIMKIADGLFHRIFDEIAAEYPEIQADSMIIDIGAAKVASAPHLFDVIVLPNLYGDIVSDIAAEITGSVGLGVAMTSFSSRSDWPRKSANSTRSWNQLSS